MKRIVLLLFFGAVAAILPAAELLRLEQSLEAMGSVYSLVAYGEDRARLLTVVDQAFEEVRRLDRMLSNYRADSELSRVNRDAGRAPVRVSEELFRLLEACQGYSRQSDGAFDITVGPLMKIWGFYKGSGRLPHRAEIRDMLGRIGYERVLLDRKSMTVRFRQDGMELDPGGIGKGYAVDRVVEILRQERVSAAFVSAGNSSIYALGAPPGKPGWRISILHPKDISSTVEEVVLKNQSMSTSGTSEKFFRAEGRLYSHIMDPRTGYPAPGMLAVSVIAPRTIDSEAWTKPVFILGKDWASKKIMAQAGHPGSPFHGFRIFVCPDSKGGSEKACEWLQ